MFPQLIKYVGVFLGSMLKFVAGPTAGVASGLTLVETFSLTVLGMMTSVFVFSSLGERMRRRFVSRFRKKKQLFSPRNRRIVTIWKRWGLSGVAFLTPVLFSPIVGTLVATSFGESKWRIMGFMFVSAVFWAIVMTLVFYYGFGQAGRAA
ncbi:MAG: hypothetical protein WBA12_06130 [Catalinimonas sp.]